MIPLPAKLFIFSRNVWHGILGILVELALVAFIIFAGFMVCVLWWGLFG
jgi:hypothetical protein